MKKSLSEPGTMIYWNQVTRSITKEWFNRWAENGEEVPLFRGISQLAMTSLVHFVLGHRFAEKYGEEVANMVRKYESSLQKPQIRSLPRWMSKEGRYLDAVEARMKVLVDEEVFQRLRNFGEYKNNADYLQLLLIEFGDQFVQCIPPLNYGTKFSLPNAYSWTVAWGPYKRDDNLCLVSLACNKISCSLDFAEGKI
jgi:hypothetical protein